MALIYLILRVCRKLLPVHAALSMLLVILFSREFSGTGNETGWRMNKWKKNKWLFLSWIDSIVGFSSHLKITC